MSFTTRRDPKPIVEKHSTLGLTLWVVAGLVVLAIIVGGVLGRLFLKRGLREPLVVRLINRASESVVDAVKRPITIAVLDEVATVLRTGNYTRNFSCALEENREEIKVMMREKIKQDPTSGRINLLPFHDRIIEGASETTLRVILEILADPRTDELVSDMLRDNINQIGMAARQRRHSSGASG